MPYSDLAYRGFALVVLLVAALLIYLRNPACSSGRLVDMLEDIEGPVIGTQADSLVLGPRSGTERFYLISGIDVGWTSISAGFAHLSTCQGTWMIMLTVLAPSYKSDDQPFQLLERVPRRSKHLVLDFQDALRAITSRTLALLGPSSLHAVIAVPTSERHPALRLTSAFFFFFIFLFPQRSAPHNEKRFVAWPVWLD